MTEREALKLALEALKQMKAQANFDCWNLKICDEAITAAEEVLAQPEQEPTCKQSLQVEQEPNSTTSMSPTPPKELQPEQKPVVRWMCKGCGHEYMEAPNSCDCMDSTEYERIEYFTAPPQRTWVGLMRGVRVDGETVVISVKGGNDAARELCSALIKEINT